MLNHAIGTATIASTTRNHADNPSIVYDSVKSDARWTNSTPCTGVPVRSTAAAAVPVTMEAAADPRNAIRRAIRGRCAARSVSVTSPSRSASAVGRPLDGSKGVIQLSLGRKNVLYIDIKIQEAAVPSGLEWRRQSAWTG